MLRLRTCIRRRPHLSAILLVAGLRILANPIDAHAIEVGTGLTLSGDTVALTSPVATSLGGTGADGSNVAANRVLASPDGSAGAVTYRALVDDDVPDTITASSYLPLAGGTLTGQLVADNLGIEFEESDTNPPCSSGNFTIYADASENKLKKCENGTPSDLDTTSAGSSVSLQGFTTTTSIDLDSGGTASMFVSPMGGSYFSTEDKATVPYDSGTISDLRCKASTALDATTTIEIAKGTCGAAITFDCQASDICASVTGTSSSTVDTDTLAVSDGECVAVKLTTSGDPADAVYGCTWTFTR